MNIISLTNLPLLDAKFVAAVMAHYQGGHTAIQSAAQQTKYFRLILNQILLLLTSASFNNNPILMTLLRENLITFCLQPTLEKVIILHLKTG